MQVEVDPIKQKYPYCIVWTRLPCFSCVIPCIGHVGICKSDGTIYDFLGPQVHCGELGFDKPVKYI